MISLGRFILRSQVSAIGCLVQVFRYGFRFGRCLAQPLTANRFHLKRASLLVPVSPCQHVP